MKWIIVLMLACPVMAQTTQPAATQASDTTQYPAMARRLRELTAEVQSLRAANDAMAKELAALRGSTTQPVAKQVSKGMTLKQVEVMWGEPDKKSQTDEGLMCVWREYRMVEPDFNPSDYRGEQVDLNLRATQQEPRKERRLMRTLTCWFQDGHVARFVDERESDKPKTVAK